MPLSFLCHSAQNFLQILSWASQRLKLQRNSVKRMGLWLLQSTVPLILQSSLSKFIIIFSLTHSFMVFFLFNCWITGNLGKWTFCINFTLQKLDLPNTTHIGNTSECHTPCWWKTESVDSTMQYSYAVASFCILTGTRKFLCIILILTVASLNFGTWVWNSAF